MKKVIGFLILIWIITGCDALAIQPDATPVPAQPTPGSEPPPAETARNPEIGEPTWATRPAVVEPDALAPLIRPTRHDQLPVLLGDGMRLEITAPILETGKLELLFSDETPHLLLVRPSDDTDLVIQLPNQDRTIDDTGTGNPEFAFLTSDSLQEPILIFTKNGPEQTEIDVEWVSQAEGRVLTQLDLEDQVSVGDLNRHTPDLLPDTISIIRLTPLNEADDLVLELYDSAGILFNIDEGGDGDIEQLVFSPSADEIYVVAVYGFRFSEVEYRITVQQLP